MFRFLCSIKAILEFVGGVTEPSEVEGPVWIRGPVFWGIWWAALILLIVAFSGQTSKFIYIDF